MDWKRDLAERAARVRSAGPAILQAAAAAGAAWFLAGLVPGHDSPLFAPVAARVALGSQQARRGRQAVELVLGVAVGIAVADLLVRAVGSGAWQLALVSALAMAAALVLFESPLFISQAGVWAILVVALPNRLPALRRRAHRRRCRARREPAPLSAQPARRRPWGRQARL